MNYLLDTNAFLMYLEGDKRLEKFRHLIESRENIVYSSIINFWEISVKNKIGKLPLKASLKEVIDNSRFIILNIDIRHILTLNKLENIHKDPFDRMLVAQAKAEKLTIITADKKFLKYKVKTIIV